MKGNHFGNASDVGIVRGRTIYEEVGSTLLWVKGKNFKFVLLGFKEPNWGGDEGRYCHDKWEPFLHYNTIRPFKDKGEGKSIIQTFIERDNLS